MNADHPSPSIAPLFREHAAFLRRLAGGLVRDPHHADDLVQQTWLALLEQREPLRSGPRAWLAAVLRNRASHLHRDEGRRRAHEEKAEHASPLSPPEEELTRLELQRALLTAVHDLDEPFRSVALRHHLDGVSLRDIAEQTGTPYATVKTRLHRAHARLRARLDDRFATRRTAMVLALSELAGPAWGTLGGTVTALAGASLMKKLLAVVAITVIAFLGPWSVNRFLFSETRGSDAEVVETPSRMETRTADADTPTDVDRQAEAPDERAFVPRSLPFAAGIVRSASGKPIEGAELRAGLLDRPDDARQPIELPSPGPVLAQTDAEGRFSVAEISDRLVSFVISAPGFQPRRFRSFSSRREQNQAIEVRLEAGSRRRVRAVDSESRPIQHAWVASFTDAQPSTCSAPHLAEVDEYLVLLDDQSSVLVDAEGRADLDLGPDAMLHVGADGYQSVYMWQGWVPKGREGLELEGHDRTQDVPLRRAGLHVDVVDPRGDFIAGAHASVVRADTHEIVRSLDRASTFLNIPPERLYLWEKWFSDEARGPAPHLFELWVGAPGHRTAIQPWDFAAHLETPHFVIELEPGEDRLQIAGQIRAAHRARVRLRPHLSFDQPPFADLPSRCLTIHANDEGHFQIGGLPPGPWILWFEAEGSTTQVLAVETPRLDLDVTLGRCAALNVQVFDDASNPCPGSWVEVQVPGEGAGRLKRTGADGRIRYDDLPAGRIELSAFARYPYDSPQDQLSFTDSLGAARDRIELSEGQAHEISLRQIARCRVTMTVRDRHGAPCIRHSLSLSDGLFLDDSGANSLSDELLLETDALGRLELDLWPGTYWLEDPASGTMCEVSVPNRPSAAPHVELRDSD